MLIVLILLVLLLGGGWGYGTWGGNAAWGPAYGNTSGVIGLVLLIAVLFLLFGHRI